MQKRIITYLLPALLTLGFIVVSGCSTKKNTTVSRTYHNVTSYYNVYFNGKDAMAQGIKKIDQANVDNYSLILPVYKHSNKEASRAAFGDMNRAIEKGSKCIRKHSITVKPQKKEGKKDRRDKEFYEKPEYVKYVDDAYLMIGKAHFYKQDFFPAIETFSFIVKEYTETPIKYDAYLWLARTYTEMGKYEKAQEFLALIEGDKGKFDPELLTEIYSTQADILIRQQKNNEAISPLEKSAETTTEKKIKMRFYYILAQLHQSLEENKKAYEYYGKVIELNPPYEMAFNAKINQASIFNADASDSKELQKQLNKMLKDDKNIDFRDQIFFALGNIARNENRLGDAIAFYQKSVAASTKNTNQKAVSYLSAADIYFEEPDYANSQIYYDSAVSFLSKDYPNYLQIKAKSQNLNDLVYNINTIYTQDSLQKLAKMPANQRNAIIDGIIQNLIAEENREKEEAARQKQELMMMKQESQQNSQQQQQGKWYFYNPNMLALGSAEFKKKWGDRKLEDNWRRINKTVMDWNSTSNEQETADTAKIKLSNKSREFYIVNIPLTDSAYAASTNSIAEAYYNIATIYKERFNDYELSIDAYKKLLDKFPGSEFELPSYYNLYKLYVLTKDFKSAEEYKLKIIKNYPDSDYAKILNNPDYFKELEARDNQLNFMYQATYKYFLNGACTEVDNNYHYVDTAFTESRLLPKFALLSTLCSGKNGDTLAFKQRLTDFIGMYPNSEEKTYAKEVLAALDRSPRDIRTPAEIAKEEFGSELATVKNDSIDASMYQSNPDQVHYYMVVVFNEKADANRVKFNLSNFNLDYYSFLEFDVSSVLLSANYTMVVVKKFKNRSMANNYLEGVVVAGEVFENVMPDTYRSYIISADNFTKFYNDKNLQRYEKFYNSNYSLK